MEYQDCVKNLWVTKMAHNHCPNTHLAQTPMLKEVFNLPTRCGNVFMLSSIDWLTHDSNSFIESVLFCWSLADSNLSWQTTKDLFNLSCIHENKYLSMVQIMVQQWTWKVNISCMIKHGRILRLLSREEFNFNMHHNQWCPSFKV